MRTFSKIYGLAGLRIGYGIGHPDFIAALEKIRQPFNINLVAQAGALAALDDTKHVEKTRKVNSRGLKLYARTFRKLGAGIHSVAGEFHPGARRRRPACVRGIAEAGRDRASDGRLSTAGMGAHHRRHAEGKQTVPRGVENRAWAESDYQLNRNHAAAACARKAGQIDQIQTTRVAFGN